MTAAKLNSCNGSMGDARTNNSGGSTMSTIMSGLNSTNTGSIAVRNHWVRRPGAGLVSQIMRKHPPTNGHE